MLTQISLMPSCRATLLCLLAGSLGCESAAPVTGDTATVTAQTDTIAQSRSGEVVESWEAYYIDNHKIGQGKIGIEPITEDGRSLLLVRSSTELVVQRFNQTVSQKIQLLSVESATGGLIRFETRLSDGSVTTGRYQSGQLFIETNTLGEAQRTSIPWDPSFGGLFADRLSLRRSPMQPGERRRLRALIPIFHQPGEIELVADGYESTPLLSGEQRLLRINSTVRIGQTTIESVLWTDSSGEPIKSSTSMSGFEQIAYRTTPEQALDKNNSTDFDLGARSVVRVENPLPEPQRTQRAVYRVRLDGGDPSRVFSAGISQKVDRKSPDTAEITVWATRPDTPRSGRPSEAGPTVADLEPNNLVQSQDPIIVAMAGKVTTEAADPWSLACALESYVHRTVRPEQFSQAIASAADVARSRAGDCTEHAVLLAALCRARQLPARVVIGLVYFPQAEGFAYHMWNEVWIEDRWIPLDATRGQCGIGAGHLKVQTSDLAGATPYNALLPVLEVLGKLEIRVESVE